MNLKNYINWGLGIGDWGFGVLGFWQKHKTQKPKPKPQTPIL